jgi:hypothetical protein
MPRTISKDGPASPATTHTSTRLVAIGDPHQFVLSAREVSAVIRALPAKSLICGCVWRGWQARRGLARSRSHLQEVQDHLQYMADFAARLESTAEEQ